MGFLTSKPSQVSRLGTKEIDYFLDWARQNLPQLMLHEDAEVRKIISSAIEETRLIRFVFEFTAGFAGVIGGIFLARLYTATPDYGSTELIGAAAGGGLFAYFAASFNNLIVKNRIRSLASHF